MVQIVWQSVPERGYVASRYTLPKGGGGDLQEAESPVRVERLLWTPIGGGSFVAGLGDYRWRTRLQAVFLSTLVVMKNSIASEVHVPIKLTCGSKAE